MGSEEWRQHILESLQRLFEHHSALYGVQHAVAVEIEARQLALQLWGNAGEIDNDMALLRAAALLHDVGFAQRNDTWTLDCIEHLGYGLSLAGSILKTNPRFEASPELIEAILFLIEHHDDTLYSYPTATRNGRTFELEYRFAMQRYAHLHPHLMILREADALVHAGDECLETAFDGWISQGIPAFGDNDAPFFSWRWMDSAIGNVRLLGKRTIVDAKSIAGQIKALEAHERFETYIRKQGIQSSVSYEPEICHPSRRRESLARLGNIETDFEITYLSDWQALQRQLRAVPLSGDRSIKPYETADLRLEVIDISAVTPMALYVVRHRLEECLELYDVLMKKYALGLWDLPGLMEFRFNTIDQRIAPPIIESYAETNNLAEPRQVLGLLDGLHRCTTARRNQAGRIRVVFVEHVLFPLVPLPVEWRLVNEYDAPPQAAFKRKYRFSNLADFPEFLYIDHKPCTDEEAQYFFYRDLSSLGSKGKRNFDEFGEKE